MAAYISFQPSDYFNTLLYDGNNSTQALTGVGFQPDATWIKARNNTDNHALYDALRGATETLYPNTDGAEVTTANGLTAFDADGFTCGDANIVNGGTGRIYASWNWKAGTTTGLSGGTITPSSYSINATAGIGIYAYAGTGSNGTIAHGLGTGSKFIMVKNLTSGAGVNWKCTSSRLQIDSGAYYNLYLNTTAAETNETATFNSTLMGDTVFNLGTNAGTNGSGHNYIAYLFSSKKGFSKMGFYQGNGNADGPFVYTGFRPAMVILKKTSGTGDWALFDNKRSPFNQVNDRVYPNESGAEESTTTQGNDFLSNGFKLRGTGVNVFNSGGDKYIFAAFAEFPFVSSNSIPTVAR